MRPDGRDRDLRFPYPVVGRLLTVIADDFGIGPETSRGILELARRGVVTGSVLIVNSPFASAAVDAWRQAGRPMELGWHPCLTLDRPVRAPDEVPSLVDRQGRFMPLGRFLTRLLLGRVRRADVESEFDAQYRLFLRLVGAPPGVVNAHQHVDLFPPVGAALVRVLRRHAATPYVRRVREPWRTIASVPGARFKRLVLSALGRVQARRLHRARLSGNVWLAGVADPRAVQDPSFFTRWLDRVPGRVVELTCHPGHWDESLVGRDGDAVNGLIQRRVDELRLLSQPEFGAVCRRNGFTPVAPSALAPDRVEAQRHAA